MERLRRSLHIDDWLKPKAQFIHPGADAPGNLFYMKQFLTLLLIIFLHTIQAQDLGLFTAHMDVGNPINKGSVAYNATTQEYTLTGSGSNMWLRKDEFHFLYRKLRGDFIITA